uniref:Uncharacterized protein n=1 Tax=Petromyzon marinus TaxID=7757 RepID=S4RC22_PETMA
VTFFTLLSGVCVMLNLAGSILSCQNAQLVNSLTHCQLVKPGDDGVCVCCERQQTGGCTNLGSSLKKYILIHDTRTKSWHTLSVCDLSIVLCDHCRPLGSILGSHRDLQLLQFVSSRMLKYFVPQRSSHVQHDCLNTHNSLVHQTVDFEEFVPPIPPPPYYPPEYTYTPVMDANRRTSRLHLIHCPYDICVPRVGCEAVYPGELPPPYEAVVAQTRTTQDRKIDLSRREAALGPCRQTTFNLTSSYIWPGAGNAVGNVAERRLSEDSSTLSGRAPVRSRDVPMYGALHGTAPDTIASSLEDTGGGGGVATAAQTHSVEGDVQARQTPNGTSHGEGERRTASSETNVVGTEHETRDVTFERKSGRYGRETTAVKGCGRANPERRGRRTPSPSPTPLSEAMIGRSCRFVIFPNTMGWKVARKMAVWLNNPYNRHSLGRSSFTNELTTGCSKQSVYNILLSSASHDPAMQQSFRTSPPPEAPRERPRSLVDLQTYEDTKILVSRFLESSSGDLPPDVRHVVNDIKSVIASDERHMEEAILSASVLDQVGTSEATSCEVKSNAILERLHFFSCGNLSEPGLEGRRQRSDEQSRPHSHVGVLRETVL